VALTAEIRREKLLFELILNAHWEPLDFELPQVDKDEASPRRRWIDTARETPDDIVPWEEAPAFPELIYRAEARSVVVLLHTGGLNGRRDPSGSACLVFPDLRTVPIRGFRPGLTKVELPHEVGLSINYHY
jgi:hypothetical protein